MNSKDTQRSAQHLDSTTKPEKKSILSAVSLPAILAASLTSVTSFLFSSKLGLTGSLIGAAIAAAVSTTASQLYNAMINSSMEKIQDLSQMHPQVTKRSKVIMQRTFLVAAAAALVALLVYAVVVNFATQGQGIGPTSFEQIEQPVTEEPSQDTTAEQQAIDEAPANTQTDENTTSTSDKTSASATETTQTQDTGTSNTTQEGTGNQDVRESSSAPTPADTETQSQETVAAESGEPTA